MAILLKPHEAIDNYNEGFVISPHREFLRVPNRLTKNIRERFFIYC